MGLYTYDSTDIPKQMCIRDRHNMEKCYLAVDIGASSGRHMLAYMAEGRMRLEEVYRFPNGMDNKDGTCLLYTSIPMKVL